MQITFVFDPRFASNMYETNGIVGDGNWIYEQFIVFIASNKGKYYMNEAKKRKKDNVYSKMYNEQIEKKKLFSTQSMSLKIH